MVLPGKGKSGKTCNTTPGLFKIRCGLIINSQRDVLYFLSSNKTPIDMLFNSQL